MPMATPTLSFIFFSSSSPVVHQQQLQLPMFYILFFLFSFLSLCVIFIAARRRLKRAREEIEKSSPTTMLSVYGFPLPDGTNKPRQQGETQQNHQLFVEVLGSCPPKWASFIPSIPSHLPVNDDGKGRENLLSDGSELDKDGGDSVGEDCGKSGDQRGKKKKKKRTKKKKQNSLADDGGEEECLENQVPLTKGKHCLDSLYPFTSSSSVTQRKIKRQYDQLVKSHDSKTLTLTQVCQFVNCLIEVRNELKHKSEIIQRKFTIAKALLFKADRSSFDRLCQQLHKLEAEQKRLEEDAVVYNWLQQQIKLSPAYKKMLEIGAHMELKAASDQLVESTDAEFAYISFEELLAQEKKDSFW
nr:TPA_asm: hypothetical protein HUJ06_002660 [Nelumbo nucifera]